MKRLEVFPEHRHVQALDYGRIHALVWYSFQGLSWLRTCPSTCLVFYARLTLTADMFSQSGLFKIYLHFGRVKHLSGLIKAYLHYGRVQAFVWCSAQDLPWQRACSDTCLVFYKQNKKQTKKRLEAYPDFGRVQTLVWCPVQASPCIWTCQDLSGVPYTSERPKACADYGRVQALV